MTVYQILCLVGIPGVISGVTGYLIAKVQKQKGETEALKCGVQSLLRDRLLQSYKNFKEKGYARADDRENFENMYQQYHNLGKNGVMDDYRLKFLELPTEPPLREEG